MRMNDPVRDRPEHPAVLLLRVRLMLPQRRDHGHLRTCQSLIQHLGDPAGAAVCPRQVRRQQQDPPQIPLDSCPRLFEQPGHRPANLLLPQCIAFDLKPRHELTTSQTCLTI